MRVVTVSVRDARASPSDRLWIESVYRDYLDDLAPLNTGIFPILGEVGHREPDQISRWVPADYTSLGADGFGFADTRGAARRFFHIDAQSIVVAVLEQLAKTGEVKAEAPREAIDRYQLLNGQAAGAGTVGGDA